jgi:hypothetical protein
MRKPINIDLTKDQPVNITCKRGDSFKFGVLRFWEDAEKTTPKNITSYSWLMKVININGDVVLEFTGSDFEVANTNELTIIKAAEDMIIPATDPENPYIYDCEQTDGDGVVSTIMSGNFNVSQDVS